MTTTTWQITQMERVTADGFVFKVWYMAVAVDGDYSASVCNSIVYTQKEGETYTPYDQLTEQQVIGWVQASLAEEGVDTDAELQAKIDLQKQPPVASGMPWYVPEPIPPLA